MTHSPWRRADVPFYAVIGIGGGKFLDVSKVVRWVRFHMEG